jgi:hypothetical protein
MTIIRRSFLLRLDIPYCYRPCINPINSGPVVQQNFYVGFGSAGRRLVWPEDLVLVKEVQDIVLKYGHRMNAVDVDLTTPICLENTENTAGKFSLKLEIYQWWDDPFRRA